MNSNVVTEETGLRIWPTSAMVACLVKGACLHAAFDSGPIVPDISPGSLKVSDTTKDGTTYSKKIVFRVPALSLSTFTRLLSLSRRYIVVAYTDERGVDRLMGSPKWPAWLSVEQEGGSISVTVEATGDSPNPQMIKARP